MSALAVVAGPVIAIRSPQRLSTFFSLKTECEQSERLSMTQLTAPSTGRAARSTNGRAADLGGTVEQRFARAST